MKRKIKRSIYRAFRNKLLNIPLRISYTILKSLLPDRLRNLYAKFPVNTEVKVTFNGSKQFRMVNYGDDVIANEVYWKGIYSYEPRALGIMMKLLGKAKYFFDIGANTGLYSLLAASLDPENKVYGFEPMETAFEHFEKSIQASSLPNIFPSKIALGNFNGEAVFNIQSEEGNIPLGSSLRTDVGDEYIEKSVKVTVQKLDSFVNDNNIKGIDFIKLDTEGTEDKVLEGGIGSIDKFRPVIICEVLSHTGTEPGIHSLLDNRSYRYYYVNDDFLEQVEKIIGDPFIVSNYLFVPSEKADELLHGITVKNIKNKEFIKN
jgi:FkbM family methyltransferase